MTQFNFYQWIAFFIFTLFLGIMIHATYKAYNRSSGSTGQDIVLIQKTRLDLYQAKKNPSTHISKP